MIPLLIGGCAAGVALAAGTLPRVLRRVQRSQLLRRASDDYHACRGTEHVNLLRQGVDRHEAAIHLLRHEIPQIEARLEADRRLEVDEIWEALTRFTVSERLTEIPGIGPKLRAALLSDCFDGTLESLDRAQDSVGVSDEKAEAIRQWVKDLRGELPGLFSEPFPDREVIESRHRTTQAAIAARQDRLSARLDELEPRLEKALEELARLSQITVFDFVHAMQGNAQAAERVSVYAMGVFPEWDPAPDWFEGILGDPEAANE